MKESNLFLRVPRHPTWIFSKPRNTPPPISTRRRISARRHSPKTSVPGRLTPQGSAASPVPKGWRAAWNKRRDKGLVGCKPKLGLDPRSLDSFADDSCDSNFLHPRPERSDHPSLDLAITFRPTLRFTGGRQARRLFPGPGLHEPTGAPQLHLTEARTGSAEDERAAPPGRPFTNSIRDRRSQPNFGSTDLIDSRARATRFSRCHERGSKGNHRSTGRRCLRLHHVMATLRSKLHERHISPLAR